MGDRELLEYLLAAEGYDNQTDFAEDMIFDSICPGICRKCQAVMDCEPDATKNWCDECNKNTVVSGLVLMGLI